VSRTSLARGAAVLLLVGLGVAIGAVFLGDDDQAAPSPLPSGELNVSAEATELAALVRKGQDLTYHAVYESTGALPSGGSLRIELWRKDGLVRQEQIVRAEGKTLHSAGFRLPNETILCMRQDSNPWSCSPTGGPTPGATPQPDPLLGEVTAELAGKDVKASDEEVDGRRARCFAISATGESAELCVTNEGVPVAIRTGKSKLELVDLSLEVDDDVFDPPVSAQASS
jgi:hypothetical protein